MPAEQLVQVLVERNPGSRDSGMCDRQAGGNQCIPSQPALLWAVIELAEQGVDSCLVAGSSTDNSCSNLSADMTNGLPDTVPVIASILLIPQFNRLGRTGTGTGGGNRPSADSTFGFDLDFHRRTTAAVEHFPRMHGGDLV